MLVLSSNSRRAAAICTHCIDAAIIKIVATRVCYILMLNVPNSISAGALPQTPLGELTALPRLPSWIWGPLRGRGEGLGSVVKVRGLWGAFEPPAIV